MAKVTFKKGLLANLPTSYSEGTLYITTDERAIYLDVDESTRVRIGDFQEFATLADLQSNPNPSTTALYYITDLNVLAKWNGATYIQINLDTGATSVEVVGDGNAVTAASYDPETRKLTLTKGTTYTTASDVNDAIDAAIGDLGNNDLSVPYSTVKEYVDDKVADVVAGSIDGLGALASKDVVSEAELDSALSTKINGKADSSQVATDIASAKDSVIGTASDPSSANTVNGAKKYADEKVATVQGSIDTLASQIGTVEEGSTIVGMIEEATYDDTALAGRVTAAENEIDTLVGDDSGKSVRTIANEELAAQLIPEDAQDALDTLAEIAAWIQSHPDDAAAMNAEIDAIQTQLIGIGAESGAVKAYVDGAIAALNIGDYAKASELAALAARVLTLEGSTHTHSNKNVLDGITSEKVTAWDSAEQNAKTYADGLASNYDAAGSANQALTDAKAYADEKDTAMDARVDALEAIDHEAYIDADSDVLSEAKSYTDTAMTWGTF